MNEPENEVRPSAVEQETARKSNNRTTLFIALGFIVAFVLLIALNWN